MSFVLSQHETIYNVKKKADYEWCKVYSKWNGDQHINTHFWIYYLLNSIIILRFI